MLRGLALMLGLAAPTLFGCTDTESKSPTQGISQFARLVELYELEPPIGDAEVEQAALAVLESAKSEDWGTDIRSDEAVVTRFPNKRIAVHILDRYWRDATMPLDSKRDLVDRLRQGAPESLAGSRAYQLFLDDLKLADPGAFLAECENILQRDPKSIYARIALFARMKFLGETSKTREAALDALQFFRDHGELAKRMGASSMLAAKIREAGWLLEASMLRTADDPSTIARVIFEQLSPYTKSANGPLSGYYFEAPDYQRVAGVQSLDALSKFERCLFNARLSFLALHEFSHEKVALHVRDFIRVANEVAEIGDVQQLSILEEFRAANQDYLFQYYGDAESLHAFEDARLSSSEWESTIGLLSDFSWLGVTLRSKVVLESSTSGEERVEKVLDQHVSFLHDIGDIGGIIKAYEYVIGEWNEPNIVAAYMLKLGDLYHEKLNSNGQALRVYQETHEKYAGTEYAKTALLKSSSVHMSQQAFGEAYQLLQEYSITYSDDEQNHLVSFLTAKCEASMGLIESAVDRMKLLTEQQDDTEEPIAARALYWLGIHFMANQDYEEARYYMDALQARYPDISQKLGVATYMQQLSRGAQ